MELIFAQTIKFLWFTLGAWVAGGGAMWFLREKNKIGTSTWGKNLGNMECQHNFKVGYILAKGIVLKPKKLLEHLLYIGPSGAKKTVSAVINNLLSLRLPPCSRIIADPKGEIYKTTHKFRESVGEKCFVFEALGKKSRINFLDYCNDFTDIRSVAQEMLMNTLKADYDKWDDMALPLLTAVLLHVKRYAPKVRQHIPEAVRLLTSTSDIKNLLKILNDDKDTDIDTQLNSFIVCMESKPTRASILITLLSKLNVFTDPRIARNLSASDFTIEEIRTRPINIYVTYEVYMIDYLKPVLALFYGQFMKNLMRSYDEELFKAEKQVPVLFILDEMQNLGKIKALSTGVTMIRSYKIALIGLIQNFSEMYEVYGKYQAETIISGCKTVCILPGLKDVEALQYFSNPVISGNTEVKISDDKGKTSKVKRPMFDGDELRRLEDDTIAIIADNKPVIKAKQDIWFENKEYVRRANL